MNLLELYIARYLGKERPGVLTTVTITGKIVLTLQSLPSVLSTYRESVRERTCILTSDTNHDLLTLTLLKYRESV